MTTISPLISSQAKSITAQINYNVSRPSSTPTEKWFIDINDPKNNTNYDPHPISLSILDMRGQETKAHIDTTGFQPITSPSSITVPSDVILTSSEEEVARLYYPEVEALLLQQTGGSRVIIFDHTIRRPPDPSNPIKRQPVLQAHSDQTPASAHRRVARHDQSSTPYKRFQIINVWRPLKNTVYDYPLAVCDFNTLDVVNDLVPTDLIYPPPLPVGETYSLRYSEKQQWWYWSEMTPNDILLLKIYDSASREMTKVKIAGANVNESELRDVAGTTPHTAFLDEKGAKKGIQRHSIEVRALVFYD